MIFKNRIIFNEASKKAPEEDDIEIEDLIDNIESANSKMDEVISKSPKKVRQRRNRAKSKDNSSIDNIESELELDSYENENSSKQNSNDPILNYEDDTDNLENIEDRIDYENENDGSDDIDYMGDENDDSDIDVDSYYDDTEELDDIEERIDNEANDEYAIDGEFDPDDELDDIEGQIDKANDEEFSLDDEEDYYEEEDPNMEMNDNLEAPQQNPENQVQNIDAEVDPELSGDTVSLPTEGLDDDPNDPNNPMNNQQGQDPNLDAMQDVVNDADNQNPMDPNLDPNDPLYDDDSDPLADGGINDTGEEKEAERLKKIVLLNQYRELINVVSDFKMTIEKLLDVPSFENDENVVYLIKQLQAMKDKIMFTVEQKFLTAEYTDLIKIYYYFKFGLNSTSKYIEKIINSKQNNKQ